MNTNFSKRSSVIRILILEIYSNETILRRIYWKGREGYFGTLVTHLGLLVTLIAAALSLSFTKTDDWSLVPGTSAELPDGTMLGLDSFKLCDETGALNYSSILTLTDAKGNVFEKKEIGVNTPLRFGKFKIYQQSYGTLASLEMETAEGTKSIITEPRKFISLEGVNGIVVLEIYPDYVMIGERIAPVKDGLYENPIYTLSIYESEDIRKGALFPGDSIDLDGVSFAFNEPVFCSGIRVKTLPAAFTAILYAGFVVLVIGLYISFFAVPACGVISDEGYNYFCSKDNLFMKSQMDRIISESSSETKKILL